VSAVPLIKRAARNIHFSQRLFDAQRGLLDRPVDLIKAKQDKVRKLIDQGLSLAQEQIQFAKDEKALVEIVYNEVVAGSFGGFRLEVV
jgi:chromosome condensin MukBEF complex kleisin-like MukF subunit